MPIPTHIDVAPAALRKAGWQVITEARYSACLECWGNDPGCPCCGGVSHKTGERLVARKGELAFEVQKEGCRVRFKSTRAKLEAAGLMFLPRTEHLPPYRLPNPPVRKPKRALRA